jgi:hypothetical protein
MKQKDILLIVVIVIVAAVVSLLITKTVFVSKKNRELTAEKVDSITAQFNQPDPKIFNKNAIDPTQLIHIGDTPPNAKPF